MVRWSIIAVLTIALVGVGTWGYKEHQTKNDVMIQAENTYQRSFHNLSYHMDVLNDKIATALAMNTGDSLSPQLTDIWRVTAEAKADVSQLPLVLLPFNKTEKFLANIGDFTHKTAKRNLDDEPLSKKETKSLEHLYAQSKELMGDLRQMQHKVLANNLQWMDVQLALGKKDRPKDNQIIAGFQTVENKVDGYAKKNLDSSLQGPPVKEHQYQFLKGDHITEQAALKKARKLLNLKNSEPLSITKSMKGASVPMYSISYQQGDQSTYMEMSEKGGKPVSLIVHRPIQKQGISLHDGLNKATTYLKQQGFKHMTIFKSDQYDNVGVYSFLYDDGGVRVFSDSIDVKVALDNGEVLGFTARNYYMNHRKRTMPKPKLTLDEAKQKVNKTVRVQENHLAVIDNDEGKEILAYEFLGVMNHNTYRIFINALTGHEERVEKLQGKEMRYQTS